MSVLERRAMERDMKRRRQSYRAKNVHTTKKSHTEVIVLLFSAVIISHKSSSF